MMATESIVQIGIGLTLTETTLEPRETIAGLSEGWRRRLAIEYAFRCYFYRQLVALLNGNA